VKRGQILALAGQTGNVSSPQLHFEIRKGSTPIDPTQYLNGN
jgi:murein DD-endopeptidase MepM/ murein hydrolase activator NlpD